MRIKSELCHIGDTRTVVRVSAWNDDKPLGTALGSGENAEIAEDRAINRLRERLSKQKSKSLLQSKADNQGDKVIKPINENKLDYDNSSDLVQKPIYKISEDNKNTINNEPLDWSEEIASIDIQLKRLGWSREMEQNYLKRAFKHPSRHRITDYTELKLLLSSLKTLEVGSDPHTCDIPDERNRLITTSNCLISELNWDSSRARSYLKENLNVSSRAQLENHQLQEFNNMLKQELQKINS